MLIQGISYIPDITVAQLHRFYFFDSVFLFFSLFFSFIVVFYKEYYALYHVYKLRNTNKRTRTAADQIASIENYSNLCMTQTDGHNAL